MIYTSHVFLTLSCVIVHIDSIIFWFHCTTKMRNIWRHVILPWWYNWISIIIPCENACFTNLRPLKGFSFFCIFKWGLIRKWMIRCTFRICLIIWNCFLRFQEMTPIASINSTAWCFNRIWSVIVFFHYDSWFPSFCHVVEFLPCLLYWVKSVFLNLYHNISFAVV